MLPIDLAKVRYEEGVLFSWVTELMVDIFNALVEGVANQLLSEASVLLIAILMTLVAVVVE